MRAPSRGQSPGSQEHKGTLLARSAASRRKVRQARPGCFHRPALVPARGRGHPRPLCPPPPPTRSRTIGQPCATRPLPAARHQNLHRWEGRRENQTRVRSLWPETKAAFHASGPEPQPSPMVRAGQKCGEEGALHFAHVRPDSKQPFHALQTTPRQSKMHS